MSAPLLTADLRERLLKNGRLMQELAGTESEPDFLPVVKLFTPDADCVWLLTELDPDDPDIAFGLCDLGMGYPELGSVSIAELESVRGGLRFLLRFPFQISVFRKHSAAQSRLVRGLPCYICCNAS